MKRIYKKKGETKKKGGSKKGQSGTVEKETSRLARKTFKTPLGGPVKKTFIPTDDNDDDDGNNDDDVSSDEGLEDMVGFFIDKEARKEARRDGMAEGSEDDSAGDGFESLFDPSRNED
jgi:hypothetical protein